MARSKKRTPRGGQPSPRGRAEPPRLLVFAGRRAKDDPLDLRRRPAAEAERRLNALPAQLARVECAAQLVQRGCILVLHLVASGLDQDQMARTLLGGGHAKEGLTLLRAQVVEC